MPSLSSARCMDLLILQKTQDHAARYEKQSCKANMPLSFSDEFVIYVASKTGNFACFWHNCAEYISQYGLILQTMARKLKNS